MAAMVVMVGVRLWLESVLGAGQVSGGGANVVHRTPLKPEFQLTTLATR